MLLPFFGEGRGSGSSTEGRSAGVIFLTLCSGKDFLLLGNGGFAGLAGVAGLAPGSDGFGCSRIR